MLPPSDACVDKAVQMMLDGRASTPKYALSKAGYENAEILTNAEVERGTKSGD